MKAISMKPVGEATNFRIFEKFSQFFANFGLWIATTGAAVAAIASAFDAHWITIPAAFIAMGALCYESEAKKGGNDARI